MDLNYLCQRRQTSLFMAEHAASCETRRIHEEFAERYAVLMAEARLARTYLRAV
jgi:hypothetical protein